MSKAKTASKNDPSNREKAKDVFYNGKKVKPVKFISESSTYIAAEYEDGNMVYGEGESPLSWASIVA